MLRWTDGEMKLGGSNLCCFLLAHLWDLPRNFRGHRDAVHPILLPPILEGNKVPPARANDQIIH